MLYAGILFLSVCIIPMYWQIKLFAGIFKTEKCLLGYLAMNVDYLEHNRWAYSKVMKEIFIF